jgi:hypothetical protein
MPPVTYKTIKLGKGKHASPDDGVCVMELASMLAREPFSDHPQSVCPVIGSFLRSYNDLIDDRRRQDLYAYAAKVVGSRATERVQRARTERLAEWALDLRGHRWTHFVFPSGWRLTTSPDVAVRRALSAVHRNTDRMHPHVLALIDELLAIGQRKRPLEHDLYLAQGLTSSDTGHAEVVR